MKHTYTAKEIFRIINEAKNEYNAVKGKGASNNKSTNSKATKEMMDNAEKLKGGKKNSDSVVFGARQDNNEINDFNSSLLNLRFANKPSQKYIDRVRAQVHGYAGVEHEKNASKEEYKKEGDFEGNKRIYDGIVKQSKAINKDREDMMSSGLVARELKKKNPDKFKVNSCCETKLVFNHTFLNEDAMIDAIPEGYKVAGNRFIVEDSLKNKYLIECKSSPYGRDFVQVEIAKKVTSNKAINEASEKIQHLMNYSSADYGKQTNNYMMKEQYDDVKTMLDTVRNLEPKPDLNNIVKI